MSIHKGVILSILFFILIEGVIWYATPKENSTNQFLPVVTSTSTPDTFLATTTVMVAQTTTAVGIHEAQRDTRLVATSSTPEATNAVLKIGDTSYPILVTKGETVIEAMRALASATSSFTFTGSEYPALGYFVDSIQGKANADGYYWILYVNDTSATTGASLVSLQAGDTVEWRYKKGY